MPDYQALPAFGPRGSVNVVVEASRGMRAKCNFDPEMGVFLFGKPLPHGLAYPFDWGFVPSTRGEDGDPLDALILHDAACPVGTLIRCVPIGVLELVQREKGKSVRNDRFLLEPVKDKVARSDRLLNARMKRELEQFFQGVVLDSGTRLTLLGWRGPRPAMAALKRGAAACAQAKD